MENIRRNNESTSRSKIPDRDRLLQRLLAINDEADFKQHIYPYLLEIAGTQLPPIAIAGVLTLAIDRYTGGDRSSPSSQLARMFIPHLIDAMLDNLADRDEVKDALAGRIIKHEKLDR